MPGLENQEWWVKELFYPSPHPSIVTPKKWKCDVMGFLTNTVQYVRLSDLKADLFNSILTLFDDTMSCD
jgi:hypothetical protein